MTTLLSVRALRGLLCLAFLCLGACGQKETPPPDATIIAALRPADPRLAEIYGTSCLACHTMADSGAPMTGDVEQWKPRLNKGMPTLVKHVVEGVNGMPAGGQCFACTPEDYTALILFMSQPPR